MQHPEKHLVPHYMHHDLISSLIQNISLTGNVREDMCTFLIAHGCPRTAEHSLRVAGEARQLATRFYVDEALAELAGWLHDISAVFPPAQRGQVARQLGLDVLPEEDAFPMILHQKLSVVIAQDVFNMMDTRVLNAIGCHTTLKADASRLDKIVFIADKLQWDSPGEVPYRDVVLASLGLSLDHAVYAYLDYLWWDRESLPVVHPWMVEAYTQISEKIK